MITPHMRASCLELSNAKAALGLGDAFVAEAPSNGPRSGHQWTLRCGVTRSPTVRLGFEESLLQEQTHRALEELITAAFPLGSASDT